MNLFVCTEADITYTAHIVRFHPPVCCDPYCCNPPWQLKAVRGWFSVYRSQHVCQTFLTLHHFLGELHQPHSVFRTWLMHLMVLMPPLMTSPSVSLTAPLPDQAFPWPGRPHHLVVTGCLCHKGSWTLQPGKETITTESYYVENISNKWKTYSVSIVMVIFWLPDLVRDRG